MPYQVLARKWRPQTFLAVMGQGHVTRTLQNALAQGRIAHAYLFSGPRGVGKTTTARLLAKALNCEQRAGAEPCTTCPACLEIQAGSAVDVIEIDGASTRGIDEIRALRENVRYAPARGQWKVYIIDEVHMLTEQAFNALLKTLEEPPPHVVFVLATTEPRRVPATIHSRCLRFEFRPVSADTISRALREIVTAERIAVAPEALARIARAAEGSLRDALSLLDAALAYATGSLTEEMVSELLGSSGSADRRAFVRALLSRDAAAALLGVDRVLREGHDPILFCRDAVEALRLALVVKLLPEPPGDVRPEDRAELQAATQSATVEEVLLALKLLTEAEAEMRRSPHPRIELELASVRIARRPVTETLEEILGRLEEAEARLRQPGLAAAPRRSAPAQGLLVETPVEAGPSPRPAQGTAAPPPPGAGAAGAGARVFARSERRGATAHRLAGRGHRGVGSSAHPRHDPGSRGAGGDHREASGGRASRQRERVSQRLGGGPGQPPAHTGDPEASSPRGRRSDISGAGGRERSQGTSGGPGGTRGLRRARRFREAPEGSGRRACPAGGGRMKGFGNLMKEAQKLQAQIEAMKDEVGKRTVEASAGGGMVTVVANGSQEILSIKIDPEAITPDDREMLEDLVLAATNEALRKAREMVTAEMGKLAGGLKLPGLM